MAVIRTSSMVVSVLVCVALAMEASAAIVGNTASRITPFFAQRSRMLVLSLQPPPQPPAETAKVMATLEPGQKLGTLIRVQDDLAVIAAEPAAEAAAGSMLSFDGGARGTLLFERCGLFFAALLDGSAADDGEAVCLAGGNLTCAAPALSDEAWAGVFDALGNRVDLDGAQQAGGMNVEGSTAAEVFSETVPQAARRPINMPLHTGVVAIDALTPIGMGQSMLVLGPDALPKPAGRTALLHRVLDAVNTFSPSMRTALVLAAPAEAMPHFIAEVQRQPWSATTRVMLAQTPAQAIIAAQTACSMATAAAVPKAEADAAAAAAAAARPSEASSDAPATSGASRKSSKLGAPESVQDSLVVVDSLALHLSAWTLSCEALVAHGVHVSPEEEDAQQRKFYSALTERAHRRKKGPSLTLLLSQPTASTQAAGEAKSAYTSADFEAAEYSQRAIGRIVALESKGIAITPEVLMKLGIPAPGSGHPQADGGRRAGQHVEELVSLVDGHIDLRENLAAQGRIPPVDPSNSLTRIGVGSHKLRPASSTEAMRTVTRALRLELAAAADPVHCEAAEATRAAAHAAVLTQRDPAPLSVGEEVALLFAASEGLLDDAAASADATQLDELVRGICDAVAAADADLLPKITRSGYLSDEQAEALRSILTKYVAQHA